MASPIGRVILQLCDQRGTTQRRVAELAGIDPSNFSKIIAGNLGTKGPLRARIANALEIEADDFEQLIRSAAEDAGDEPLPRTSAGDGARILEPPVRDGAIVEVWGDSMEPTLMHGDRVKVKPIGEDHSELHDGAVVFVELTDGLRAWYRWMRSGPGVVDLVKDNERYPARKGVKAVGENCEIASVAVPVSLTRAWVR